MRKITVIKNGQDAVTFEAAVNTLAELKVAMGNNNIIYSDMDFMEGISRTMLVDDFSQLPSNTIYKGKQTNDLVILLSTPNKKIKSGASRNDLISEAKKVLENCPELRDRYCIDNITRVKSTLLEVIIEEGSKEGSKKTTTEAPILETPVSDNKLYSAFSELVSILFTSDIINESEFYSISNILNPTNKVECPYSDEELTEFKNLI